MQPIRCLVVIPLGSLLLPFAHAFRMKLVEEPLEVGDPHNLTAGLLLKFEEMQRDGVTINAFLEAAEIFDDFMQRLGALNNPRGHLSWLERSLAWSLLGSRSCEGIYPFALARQMLRENVDKGQKAKVERMANGITGEDHAKKLDTGRGSDGSDALFWVGKLWQFLFETCDLMFKDPSRSLFDAGTAAATKVFGPISLVMEKGLKVGLKCAPTRKAFLSFLAGGSEIAEAQQLALQHMMNIASASRVYMDEFPDWDL